MLYTAIISFALGILAGALIVLNNKAKAEAAKAKAQELIEKAKTK